MLSVWVPLGVFLGCVLSAILSAMMEESFHIAIMGTMTIHDSPMMMETRGSTIIPTAVRASSSTRSLSPVRTLRM